MITVSSTIRYTNRYLCLANLTLCKPISFSLLFLQKLNVSAILQQEDTSYYLMLTISDNGVGFPDSLLQDIENYVPPFSIGNEHIGLKNLLSRFYYFYDGNAFIHLCNLKNGGACAEVKIPIEL